MNLQLSCSLNSCRVAGCYNPFGGNEGDERWYITSILKKKKTGGVKKRGSIATCIVLFCLLFISLALTNVIYVNFVYRLFLVTF